MNCNEEVDDIGNQGKAGGSTDYSTKPDEDNDELIEESGSSDDYGIDINVYATAGTISSTAITVGYDLNIHVFSGDT